MVFGAGFVLGTVRVLATAPRIGARTAELLELPAMLGVCFLASGWVNRRLAGDVAVLPRLGIGALALALLLAAEVATGIALRGVSVRDALVNPDPVSGALYYLSLAIFAALPALRAPRSTVGRR
jgi:hypothetical protein